MKIFLTIILFLPLLLSAQKIKYGIEIGYGLEETTLEEVVYDKFMDEYKWVQEMQSGARYHWDYMNMRNSDGTNYNVNGFVDYNPIKWVKLRSGLGVNLVRSEFKEEGNILDLNYIPNLYSLGYLAVPIQIIFLDNFWFMPYAGINSNLRVFTSKNLTNTFKLWEESSGAEGFKLNTSWYKFTYELGIKVKIWKTELSISRVAGISPYFIAPDFYEKLSDGTETESKGKMEYYSSGFQFKLSVPLGNFELK